MSRLISFSLYSAAILLICSCLPSISSSTYKKRQSLPSHFQYKLGDGWTFATNLKNLPPGGNSSVFITYESDTSKKGISKIYPNKTYVNEINNLIYERVLVDIELTTAAGRCTKQRILEGSNDMSSQKCMNSSGKKTTIFLGSDACLGKDTQFFLFSIDFQHKCNDDILFGVISWSSKCQNDSRVGNTTDSSGTFNATGISNATSKLNGTGTSNTTGTLNATGTLNGTSTSNATGTSNATSTFNATGRLNPTGTSNATGTLNGTSTSSATSISNATSTLNATGRLNATGTFNTSSTSNATLTSIGTDKLPELNTTCFAEKNNGASIPSSLKRLVVLIEVTSTILNYFRT